MATAIPTPSTESTSPSRRASAGSDAAICQWTVVGAVHDRIDIAVIPHVDDGTSGDRQEQAHCQAEEIIPVHHRAAGAHVPGQAGGEQQAGLQRFGQRPIKTKFGKKSFQERLLEFIDRRDGLLYYFYSSIQLSLWISVHI